MKRKSFIVVCMLSACICVSAQTLLHSASDGSPVIDAFLCDEAGNLVGMTASDGMIPADIANGTTLYAKHFLGIDVAVPAGARGNGAVPVPALQWDVKVKNAQAGEHTHIRLHTVYRLYEYINGELCYIKDGTADYVLPVKGNGKAKKRVSQLRIMSSPNTIDIYDDLCSLPDIRPSQLFLNNNVEDDVFHTANQSGYTRTSQRNGALRYASTNKAFRPVNATFFGVRTSAHGATAATYYDIETHLLKALHQTAEVQSTIKKQTRCYVVVKDVYVVEAEYMTKKEAKAVMKQYGQDDSIDVIQKFTDTDQNNIGFSSARSKLTVLPTTDKMCKAVK